MDALVVSPEPDCSSHWDTPATTRPLESLYRPRKGFCFVLFSLSLPKTLTVLWLFFSLSLAWVLDDNFHCQSIPHSSTHPLFFWPPQSTCSLRLSVSTTIINHSKSSFILIGANPPAVSPRTAFSRRCAVLLHLLTLPLLPDWGFHFWQFIVSL